MDHEAQEQEVRVETDHIEVYQPVVVVDTKPVSVLICPWRPFVVLE